jgi:MSHA type pilus biogenesis protein MshL
LTISLAAAAAAVVGAQSGPLPPVGVLQPAGTLIAPGRPEPGRPRAAAPLEAVPVIQLDAQQPHPELDGQRISLAFSDPTPIREILMMLVSDTQLSLIPAPSLDQTFVGDLKNVSIREALDLILESLGLDYSVQGNVIRVFPRELETRFYSVDYVITQRTGIRGTSTSGSAGSLAAGNAQAVGAGAGTGAVGGGAGRYGSIGGSTSQLSGSDDPDFYGSLEDGVRALLSADGTMNLDRNAGLLQVTDAGSRLDRVAQYIDAVMLRVQRQVQIEAKVVEVELRDEFSAGINWRAVISSLTNSTTLAQTFAPPAVGGFTLAFDSGDFSALLDAFAKQGKVNVLQSPHVTAMNNQPAVIRIGTQDVFFTTTTQTGEQGQILQTTVTPQSITEGVVLSVTPQISADGVIHMSINPTITERAGVATSRLGDTVPIVNVRETDSLVRVRQGETIVIAGMMQDSTNTDVTKVPVLGDVPVVGNLFKRTERTRRKTDLVILLTPTVMGPGQISAITARELQRLDEAQNAAGRVR